MLMICIQWWQEDAVKALDDKIEEMLAEAEKLGSEGEVEKAKEVLDEVEKVKVEKVQAEVWVMEV